MRFSFHAETDTGLVRSLNEDCVQTVRPDDEKLLESRGELLVVADGMGGHQSGEVASRQAAETISKRYYQLPGGPASALVQAIKDANTVVYHRAQEENRRGMGTTVVAAARVEDKLYIAHVGDSRLYLIRNNQIRPLTEDHSLVAEQVAAGILTPEEAERHPHRNVISRAVGTSPDVEVELAESSPLELHEGDLIILCSDGLTEHVRAPRIMQLVQNRTPQEAAQVLIEAAKAGGGSDNISVIVARVGEMPDAGTKTTPIAATSARENAPTAPLPATEVERLAGSYEAQEEVDTGGRSNALLGIIASVVVVVLVSGLGYMALATLQDGQEFEVIPTTESGFIITGTLSPPATTTSTAVLEVVPAVAGTVTITATRTPTEVEIFTNPQIVTDSVEAPLPVTDSTEEAAPAPVSTASPNSTVTQTPTAPTATRRPTRTPSPTPTINAVSR